MRRFLLVASVAALAALGCSTKTKDCEKFSKVAASNLDAVTKAGGNSKAMVDALKKGAVDAKGLSVDDRGLQPLVATWADVWQRTAGEADGLTSDDGETVRKTVDRLDALGAEERDAIDKVNAYCGAVETTPASDASH